MFSLRAALLPRQGLVREDEPRFVLPAEAEARSRRYRDNVSKVIDFARKHFGDAVFIALFIGAEGEAAFSNVHFERLPIVLLAPFWTLPLLLRRRFPIGAPTVGLLAIAATVAIDPKGNNNLSFPFFSALACVFVFGGALERRKAYAGGLIATAVLVFVSSMLPNKSVGNYLWPLALFAAVWAAGFFLASRSQQIAEAAPRAEAAERAREEEAREAGLPVELHVEGKPVQLAAGVDLTAYRLVQEGLTNAVKHAKAEHAEVVVRYSDGHVEITVSDDGRGGGHRDGGGHGLVGMRERVSVYGGELQAGPRPEGGFALHARL